jgi:hypothetical protein
LKRHKNKQIELMHENKNERPVTKNQLQITIISNKEGIMKIFSQNLIQEKQKLTQKKVSL